MVEGEPKHISVKLFQNLFTGLTEVVKYFLFIALVAILFNGAERFQQFVRQSPKEIFLYNYFKIEALIKEEKSFKGFSILALAAILINGAEQFEKFG